MSLRVAMVGACPYPVPQGSQVLLRDTAAGLRTAGHEVHLVVYGHGYGADSGADAPIHRTPLLPGCRTTAAGPFWGKPLLDMMLVRTLRRVIREHRIELVHAHNYEGLLAALAARQRPVVYHAHNAMSDELPYYFARHASGARAFGRWLDRTFPRRADHVIAPHARLAAYLVHECGCGPRRVSIVPPGMDTELFETEEPPPGGPAVLYTGNCDAYQNLGLLEGAMVRVRAAMPQARLVVATHAPCEIQADEVLRVEGLAGLRTVLARDAVVAAPRVSWSGYPMKLLNAMAAGRPVVACASSAHPIEDGLNGLTAPDGDVEGFARALLRLLANPQLRRKLGRAARQTIRNLHAPGGIAGQIEAVYTCCLENGAELAREITRNPRAASRIERY